jgi:hypothetical protein
MNTSKMYAREGKVTVDDLAGMTKRRFDELEDQMDYRFDQIEKRIDKIDSRLTTVETKVDDLAVGLKDLTAKVDAGFKSLQKSK